MAVRIRIEIEEKRSGNKVELAALLNSGFETDAPQLLIPSRVAELLGLLPNLPDEAVATSYETAGGFELETYLLKDWASVGVLATDKKSDTVVSSLVISNRERETVLSDSLISSLGIIIDDAAGGKWRFREEAELRDSESKQLW